MTSYWSFSEVFFIYFFRPLDPKSEKKNPVNRLIKNLWPNDLNKKITYVKVQRQPTNKLHKLTIIVAMTHLNLGAPYQILY